jgi:RNA polymerase sigma factor (sigma-70 family)
MARTAGDADLTFVDRGPSKSGEDQMSDRRRLNSERGPSAKGPLLPFEVILERHGPAVLRFCVARLGRDRGEETSQETLIAALRNYEQLRDPTAVAGWLFSIAQRKIIDLERSRTAVPIPPEQIEELADGREDLGRGESIWPQVAGLPRKQRDALALRYLADLSHADIARAMDTSVEAARRNVFEGLKRLRKELAGSDPAASHEVASSTVLRT